MRFSLLFFFFQAEDGIRDGTVTGVQTCALPISRSTRGEVPDDAIRIDGDAARHAVEIDRDIQGGRVRSPIRDRAAREIDDLDELLHPPPPAAPRRFCCPAWARK